MGLFQVAYNGYVGKAPLPQRHPERSRGIFLAGGDKVVCVIAEKGKPFAKGARKHGAQGRFLDCARNDGMGGSKSPRNVGWRQAVLSVSSYRA